MSKSEAEDGECRNDVIPGPNIYFFILPFVQKQKDHLGKKFVK